ncbi:GTP-binding protein [Gordonia jinhuaensis]|uniref:Cobalamin biosynthesis protein CobW n=1 Tax=Gordonia jinhuaensis TaxID=1517702 RepID=A0A916TGJ7_9ACTN|nr:GTP-binding protein [Gordonia jinhuaensis]GGB44023.1 cobalamin biosynthesis protein CobW [Gordonia jinhuaensis]
MSGRAAGGRHAVPVVVIAGFLGAGKTTLLNHLLRHANGRRIGVVVNDFGSINVDALLVSGQVGAQMTLSNGCICCSVGPDELHDTLARLARPSAGLDAVIIEASGLAEPGTLISMVVTAADPHVAYGGLVYVVDARHAAFDGDNRGGWAESAGRVADPQVPQVPGPDGAITSVVRAARVLRTHVALGDLVLVNKSDLVDESRRTQLTAAIREVNRQATILCTRDAVVDPDLILDAATARADDGPRQLGFDELLADLDCDHAGHHHLHEGFTSVEFSSTDPLDPRALADFLREPPVGVFRVKGVVWFDLPAHRGGYEVHSVGGHVRMRERRWRHDEQPSSALVVIGVDVDSDQAQAAMAALRRTATPDAPGVSDGSDLSDAAERIMLPITRYLI